MSAPDRMRGLAGDLILDARGYGANRKAWLEARRSGLGASDTAAVLGLSAYSSPMSVYLDKVDTGPVDDSPPSAAAQRGNDLEDMVAKWTVRDWPELGKVGPTPGLIAHEEEPWMLATLDRLLYPRGTRDASPLGVLEVKTTSRWNYEQNWVDGVPPGYVQVQVQQQLAVTGLASAWVACYLTDAVAGRDLMEPYRIDADPAVHEQLMTYAGAWWRDHVEARVEPPAIAADVSLMRALHMPNLDAAPVTADDQMAAAVAAWSDAKRRESEAKKEKEALSVPITDAMRKGEANSIARPDGQLLVTWKRNKSTRAFDAKKFQAERPDDAEPYMIDKPGAVNLRTVKGWDE